MVTLSEVTVNGKGLDVFPEGLEEMLDMSISTSDRCTVLLGKDKEACPMTRFSFVRFS